MKKVGFGIIGTGAIAAHHAASMQKLNNCRLVAVCSSSAARAAKATAQFGVEGYADLDVFLKREDLDAVSICTASGNHLAPALAAAKAGKHVLLEKPIEVSLERADEIISVCRSLGVIFQNRFTPAYRRLKEAVAEGRLGKLILGNAYIKWFRDPAYYASSDWKGTLKGDGGAALINQGIHTIDLLLDIMQEIDSLFGQVRTTVHQIEGEDLGLAMLNFKNGALGSIVAGTALYPGYPERLEIYGERGNIILEGGQLIEWNIQGAESPIQKDQLLKQGGTSDPMAVDYKLHMAQIRDMVSAIQEDREPLVNGEEARKSLALIQAIYQSSQQKIPIYLT